MIHKHYIHAIIFSMSVSPACAGMIPILAISVPATTCEPRMRGDDPNITSHLTS